MKKFLFFILVFFCFKFLYSQEEEKPQVTVPEATHDMGDVLKGTKIEYSFVIKNTGTSPLKIIQARPT
jgi:hypothetical protein